MSAAASNQRIVVYMRFSFLRSELVRQLKQDVNYSGGVGRNTLPLSRTETNFSCGGLGVLVQPVAQSFDQTNHANHARGFEDNLNQVLPRPGSPKRGLLLYRRAAVWKESRLEWSASPGAAEAPLRRVLLWLRHQKRPW